LNDSTNIIVIIIIALISPSYFILWYNIPSVIIIHNFSSLWSVIKWLLLNQRWKIFLFLFKLSFFNNYHFFHFLFTLIIIWYHSRHLFNIYKPYFVIIFIELITQILIVNLSNHFGIILPFLLCSFSLQYKCLLILHSFHNIFIIAFIFLFFFLLWLNFRFLNYLLDKWRTRFFIFYTLRL